MCEFLSWIELPNGELKYISDFELGTREGVKLKKFLEESFFDEIVGHGAIKTYFGLKHGVGKDCECIDFSTPDNFPDEIVQKIKAGKFSQLGIKAQLLSYSAKEEYSKVRGLAKEEYRKVADPAWKEYLKMVDPAWEEYRKVADPSWKEYRKVAAPSWKEYLKMVNSAKEEYRKVRGLAWEEYRKAVDPAWEEYKKAEGLAWEEYKKVKVPAWKKYKKAERLAFWKLFANPKNRSEKWR